MGEGHIFHLMNSRLNFPAICSVGYQSELHVAMTFYQYYRFYQLSYIIFFGVHSNFLCYLENK